MLGNILRSLRKKHGYSQDDVSDKIKVKRSTYANYERETREPNISVLIELADVYGVSVDYLLGHVATNTMPDDERQLVEKYNQLTDEGRMRINSQIDCELRVDALVAEKRREIQRRGVEAAQKSGKPYGRPKAVITADWNIVYKQWKSGDITADDAARKLGISKATLYRMARREK